MIVAYFVLIVLSGYSGGARQPHWTVLAWPAASILIGALSLLIEPSNYDMHGVGLQLGLITAGACVVLWLVCRGVATALRRLN